MDLGKLSTLHEIVQPRPFKTAILMSLHCSSFLKANKIMPCLRVMCTTVAVTGLVADTTLLAKESLITSEAFESIS